MSAAGILYRAELAAFFEARPQLGRVAAKPASREAL